MYKRRSILRWDLWLILNFAWLSNFLSLLTVFQNKNLIGQNKMLVENHYLLYIQYKMASSIIWSEIKFFLNIDVFIYFVKYYVSHLSIIFLTIVQSLKQEKKIMHQA